MPFQKSVQRVLGGSLNLRARGTEIADHEHQKSINVAYDQNNGIRSRKGHESICSASDVKQMMRAMGSRWQATGSAYIAGFKKYIWKMGGGAANKDCGAIISQGGPRKSDGTSDWRWIAEAPTDKATIKTAEEVITVVDDFSGGWEVDPDDTEFEFGAHGIDGLFIQGSDDTVISATKEVGLNLYDGQDIDDVFKIKVAAKKWSNVAGVTFEVDVGDGSFTNDYYRVRMPLNMIKAARKEIITFYLRKRIKEVDVAADDKFRYGAFERVGSATDKDWRSVVKLRVKVEFTLATRFWFVAWDMIGDEDNTLEGDDYKVYYTYTTEDGHESNPSPPSDAIVVNHASIEVSEMKESADPQVTGKNVYLTGGTLGAVYRVNGAKEAADGEDDPGPVMGATYTIIASADDLTNFDVVLEDDHDDPPDADGDAGPYYGRILAWKGSRFYWSHLDKPYAFANPDGPDGDWADVDENAGDIKWISIRPHEAWLYGENEIFILVGDPADAAGEVHPSGIAMGTPSRTGVAKAGGVDVAYLGQGIYLVDGSSIRKISQQIDPIFKGRAVTLWDGTSVQPVGNPSSVAVGYDDGIVWVSYDAGTVRCELATQRWFQDNRSFTCFQGESEAGILGALNGGGVVKLESGTSDGGAAISLDFLSKAYDCGINDNEKRFEDVTVRANTGGQALTLTVYYAEGIGVSTTLGNGRTVFQLNSGDGIRARNLAIRIHGDVTDEVFIDSIDINYYPEAREAKSFDTQVSDAGTPKVKLIRELHADLENATDVTLKLETDVPSFALTSREVHTIGTNLFRRTEPVVMNAERYGHDFRVVASGTGYFHMFGVRALVQEIGLWLHGQKSEYYLSDPLDFSSERIKLIKEIEIVYSTAGTVALTLSTDLPGNKISSRFTSALLATVGEQSVKIPTGGLIKGRLYQLRLEPTVDCRIEAIRFWMKLVGAPSATSWAWVDLPQQKTQDAIWTSLSFGADAVG